MFIGTDYQEAEFVDYIYAVSKTVLKMVKNEIELGLVIVTGRQSVGVDFYSVAHASTSLRDSSLRDGVDWLVSELCSGEVYYNLIAKITGYVWSKCDYFIYT